MRCRPARAAFDVLPVRMFPAMASHDVFHAILELELFLLEGDFFKVFGRREVLLGGEFVQAIFEFVMLDRESVKLLVGLHQLSFCTEWFGIHSPPP
jgi:hypothetical protein